MQSHDKQLTYANYKYIFPPVKMMSIFRTVNIAIIWD